MGYIIEPKGIDLIVAPSELTTENAKAFSTAISYYKKTGKAPAEKAVKKINTSATPKAVNRSKVA